MTELRTASGAFRAVPLRRRGIPPIGLIMSGNGHPGVAVTDAGRHVCAPEILMPNTRGFPRVPARSRKPLLGAMGQHHALLHGSKPKSASPPSGRSAVNGLGDSQRHGDEKPQSEFVSAALIAGFGARHSSHVGLLWTPDVEQVPGSLRAYESSNDFWHTLVMADFDTGAPAPTRWCSYHTAPFRPERRLQEPHRVLSLFQEPDAVGGVAADWNSISADLRPDGSYYDPGPYLDRDHRKLRYQVSFDPNDADAPKLTDWRAGEFLRREPGGLHDTAAVLDTPWQWSCGHWVGAQGKPDDFGRQRINTLRVTENVAATARAHTIRYGPGSEAASDHLLVTADFVVHGLEVAAA